MIVQRIVRSVVSVAAFLAVIRLSSAGREAAFGWGVLILALSLCLCGIAQMARDYLARRRMGRQGREVVSGWCDLEGTATPPAIQSGGSKILDHPMRDRFLDG